MRIKNGDTVVVITGKDKGKKGRVLEVLRDKDKVVVEGVHLGQRATKPNRKNQKGGIIEREMPIHASNVMLYDAKAGKGVRVGYKLENGQKMRISRSTKDQI